MCNVKYKFGVKMHKERAVSVKGFVTFTSRCSTCMQKYLLVFDGMFNIKELLIKQFPI